MQRMFFQNLFQKINPRHRPLFFLNTSVGVTFVISVFITIFYQRSGSTLQFLDAYWMDIAFQACTAMIFIGPLIAAGAAWSYSSYFRSHVWEAARVRSDLFLSVRVGVPFVVVGLVSSGVSWGILIPYARYVPQGTTWFLPLINIFMICAAVCFGMFVGRYIQKYIAAPICIVVSYAWLVLPQAYQPLWLRLPNGIYGGGGYGPSLAFQGKVGASAMLVSGGTVLASLIFLSFRNLWWGKIISCLSFAICLTVAFVLVYGLGADPVVSRKTNMTCASSDGETVCVWPEDRGQLQTVLSIILRYKENMNKIGISIPAVASEDDNHSSFTFDADGEISDEIIFPTLIQGMTATSPTCVNPTSAAITAQGQLELYFAYVSGLSMPFAENRFQALPTRELEEVLKNPAMQHDWVVKSMATLKQCES